MAIHVGIDPGIHGAVAIIYPSHPEVFDTPIIGTRTKPGGYNAPAMAMLLRPYQNDPRDVLVTIEQAQAMPRQGVSSTFKIGYGFGLQGSAMPASEPRSTG